MNLPAHQINPAADPHACEAICTARTCTCPSCGCPDCLRRAQRARQKRLVRRPGRPTQLVIVYQDDES